ncbi:GT4 family glycosyltransferase PelF [Actinoplanes sp. NPDC049802]|uniref:GT4 family glycosyltransferase PelF n=1 Tax=Actinoplanes sp. NPDC049802 TaxID=3154742 RepID=UPI0034092DBF
MRLALLTEGTYPYAHGGVSVWCDQLIRALPRHHFDVYAICATGREESRWEVPDWATVHRVPLWPGTPPRRSPARPRPDVAGAYHDLLSSLVTPDGDAGFDRALRHLATAGDGTRLPDGDRPIGWLLDAWRHRPAGGPPMSVCDAMRIAEILERWLLPLLWPGPPADLAHATANGLAALPALAAKWRHGTPMLVSEHGVYLRERYLCLAADCYPWPVRATLLRFQRLLCTTVYRTADLVVAGNRYNRRWERHLGVPEDRLRTIYNGVDPDEFPAVTADPAVPALVWTGRFDPVKDLETLIRAFALVHERMPEARLRIVGGARDGDPVYRQRCADLAGELGAAGAVEFTGRVPAVREVYAHASVAVQSSVSEGFPYALIEAMMSGVPVVCTGVGGVPEAVGGAGIVVPPRDPDALAAGCLRLLADAGLRHRLGGAGRARALRLFTTERAVGAYDEVYRELTAGRPA